MLMRVQGVDAILVGFENGLLFITAEVGGVLPEWVSGTYFVSEN